MPALPIRAEYEVWKGDDNRDYMIKCTGLLPSDSYVNVNNDYPRNVRPEIADKVSGKSNEEIASFISALCKEVVTELENMEDPPCNSAELTAFLHRRGVSIRHMGLMYVLTTSTWLRKLLYIEMIARAAKCILWKNLRCIIYNEKTEMENRVKSGADKKEALNNMYEMVHSSIITNIATFLNYTLSYNQDSQTFWTEGILTSVFSKFIEVDNLSPFDCNPWELFHALIYHCGLTINYTGQEPLFQSCFPFPENCAVNIPCRIKTLLPPSLHTDPEWLFVESLTHKSSGYYKNQAYASDCLQQASSILAAQHAPLLASCYLTQAGLYQQRGDYDTAVTYAKMASSSCGLFDSVYMRALSVFFFVAQDPYNLIQDINSYLDTYIGSSYYLPWIVFAVGVYAHPQDPSLGMDYIQQAILTCNEMINATNPIVGRIKEQIADVDLMV